MDEQELLTPAEVARLFRVDPKTVQRWANQGLLPCIRTLGGHRRFPAAAVREQMSGNAPKPYISVRQVKETGR